MSSPPTPSLDRTAGPDELARMSQDDRDAQVRRMLGKIKQAVADRGGEEDGMSGGSGRGSGYVHGSGDRGGHQSIRPGMRLLKIGGVDMTNGVDAELRPGTDERETGNKESGIEQLLGATGPPPAPPASLMHFGGVPGALGPDGMPAMPSSLWSNFYFQARHGTLEWRQIDRLDLDRVVRDVDVGALQDVLGTIAFAQMSVQNVRGQSDALVVKSFFVAQLCIEYLLNVQNMLFQTLELHRRAIEEGAKSRQATAGRLKRAQRDLSAMKKMLKQHKRAMSTYDGLLAMRGSGPQQQGRRPLALVHGSGHQHEHHAPKGVTVHCCRICDKRFRTYEFLKKHFDRRHPGNPVDDKAQMDKQISRLAAAMEKAAESTMSATRERMRSVAISESYEQAEKERRVLLARVEKLTAEREKWQHVLGQLLPTQKKQSLRRVVARRTHEVLASTWAKLKLQRQARHLSRTSTHEMKTFRDEMKRTLLRRALIRARKGALAAVFRGLWHQGVYYQMRKENIVANKTVRVVIVIGSMSLLRWIQPRCRSLSFLAARALLTSCSASPSLPPPTNTRAHVSR